MEIVETNSLSFDALDLELKAYAKENGVPIILDDGLLFLEMILKLRKPKAILEIGTAIGYSAIRMAKVSGADIITLEKSKEMATLAKENILRAGLSDKICVLEGDALEVREELLNKHFDLIFIDAAKAQYERFFTLYRPLLEANGVIVCDNMLFHGLVMDNLNEGLSRSVRGLIRKLNQFHQFLLKQEEFDTTIYNIGDGLAVSIKRS